MKTFMLRALPILTLAFSLSALAKKGDLLIQNANVVFPELRFVLKNASILIKNGNVEKISWSKFNARETKGIEKLDLNGKYVMPGMIDMHTHAWWNWAPSGMVQDLNLHGSARMMLYTGVTSFLDLFTNEKKIFKLRNDQREALKDLQSTNEDHYMADIFAAGPILAPPGGHGTEYGVETRIFSTKEQSELVIADLAKQKPDVIKFVFDNENFPKMPSFRPEVLQHAIKYAQSLGYKTVVHPGNWKDIEDSSKFGADAVAHLSTTGIISKKLSKLLRKNRTAVIPTTTIYSELLSIINRQDLLENKLLNEIIPTAFKDMFKVTENQINPFFKELLLDQKQAIQPDGQNIHDINVRRMFRNNVNILAGSDAGNVAVFQGYALLRELQRYSEAKVPNWKVLYSGTISGAKFLGFNNQLSSRLGNGKMFHWLLGDIAKKPLRANLVILNGSPVKDIKNIKKLAGKIIYHGIPVERAKLREKFINSPIVQFFQASIYRP